VVHCPIDHAWQVFTEDLASWWPFDSHSVGGPGTVVGLTGTWAAGEDIGERRDDGSVHRWCTVAVWEPPTRLVLSWNPGGHPADTEVEVTFEAQRPGLTRVVLTHRGWERLGERAAEVRRSYEDGWRHVLVPYEQAANDPEVHRTFGITLNLTVWRELDRADRTGDDNQRLVDAAHASLWHWAQVGTPANLARGEWLCAHAYTLVGRAEPALHHARRCLAATEANGLGDFDAFYAGEAMARALALAGEPAEAAAWRERAAQALGAVTDPEDRAICEADLAAGPWFALGGPAAGAVTG
jgi:uncharacterized protein YndB with AHSA1/START domain